MKKRGFYSLLFSLLVTGICVSGLSLFIHCNEPDGSGSYSCVDADGDGYPGTGCLIPLDCDDEDPNNWISCTRCKDADADSWYAQCDAYKTISGPDCDDTDPDNWISCDTCNDADADSYYAGCDAYTTIQGYDCNDNNHAVNPVAEEVCNGIDDNCNGLQDEGFSYQKLGDPVLVGQSIGTDYPCLVWTGSEYGLLWSSGDRWLYFARLDETGQKIGGDILIEDESELHITKSSLVWNGDGYGLTWHDSRDGSPKVYFIRLDSEGNQIGDEVQVTNSVSSENPSLVWTGIEYGIAFKDSRDGNLEIYFARLNSEGVKIGSDIRVTDDPDDSGNPQMVWNEDGYGLVWEDGRDGLLYANLYFARLGSDGQKIDSDIRITDDGCRYPSRLVWTGSKYGISWHGAFFAQLDPHGNKIGDDLLFSAGGMQPSLAWTGNEYGTGWTVWLGIPAACMFPEDCCDGPGGSPWAIAPLALSRIDYQGNKIGDDLIITEILSCDYDFRPVLHSLGWADSNYGLVWKENNTGNYKMYFTRIGCP